MHPAQAEKKQTALFNTADWELSKRHIGHTLLSFFLSIQASAMQANSFVDTAGCLGELPSSSSGVQKGRDTGGLVT